MSQPQKHGKVRLARDKGELGPAPAFVMVEPQLGENIGALARAMLNFGMSELAIVRPRDGWPNEKAVATASGAAMILERARVVPTLAEALGEFNHVLAMTARPRESLLPVFTPREAAGGIKARISRGEKCAILLGPERTGLSNDDVARSDGVIAIPVNPAFASLNVAQAGVVMAYEWAIADEFPSPPSDLSQAPQANREQFEGLIDHLFAELSAVRYFFPAEKRESMERKLKTLFVRAQLTEGEVRTLRGVIKALVNRRSEG